MKLAIKQELMQKLCILENIIRKINLPEIGLEKIDEDLLKTER